MSIKMNDLISINSLLVERQTFNIVENKRY